MIAERNTEEKKIWSMLDTICDPEIPVLSVTDLGIIRYVIVRKADQDVEVGITPTYSGCPAIDAIAMSIRFALLEKGYAHVSISRVLSPAWTTDWMTDAGKQKLKAYGIVPPGAVRENNRELFQTPPPVQCPLCNSPDTYMISEFGSTACKSLYRCNECKEPFDVFKCH